MMRGGENYRVEIRSGGAALKKGMELDVRFCGKGFCGKGFWRVGPLGGGSYGVLLGAFK